MKKTLSIMLLSALLLCSCTEPSVDTVSDISSETASQTISEDTASIVETSTAESVPPEEEVERVVNLYNLKLNAQKTIYAQNGKELIEEAMKSKKFSSSIEELEIEIDETKLTTIYEYTFDEYVQTGRIEPRATGEYFYGSHKITIKGDESVIHPYQSGGADFVENIDELYPMIEMLGFDIKTIEVKLVLINGWGYNYYIKDADKQALIYAYNYTQKYEDPSESYQFAMCCYNGTEAILLDKATYQRALGVSEEFKEGGLTVANNDLINIREYFEQPVLTKDLQYLGVSNGWRIYHATYEGQACDTAIVEKDLGGYKFYSSGIYSPSEVAVYAIKQKEVLTLEKAYEKGEIDIKEVHEFTPDEYKR